jgi:sRNA-binding protein
MSTDTLPTPAPTSDALPGPAAPPAPADTAATAAQLKQLFPGLFAGAPKPIKLRIHNDIQERAPGVFSKQALSAFFRRYTGSTSYLIAVTRAKERFDLDGQPSGELSEEHRKIAADELARRRALHEERRELDEQQRRNRATLLRDFERTTLTPANFSALKGITLEELDRYLAQARDEAADRTQPAPPQQARRLPRR